MKLSRRGYGEVVYPSFRGEIVQALVEKHNVNPDEAEAFVYHPAVVRKMDSDIVWACTMGPDFWAFEIAEILSIQKQEEEKENEELDFQKST